MKQSGGITMASLRAQAQFAKSFAKSGKVSFPKGTPRAQSGAIKASLAKGRTPAQANSAGIKALKTARSGMASSKANGSQGGS
jgi:hypothetical protein